MLSNRQGLEAAEHLSLIEAFERSEREIERLITSLVQISEGLERFRDAQAQNVARISAMESTVGTIMHSQESILESIRRIDGSVSTLGPHLASIAERLPEEGIGAMERLQVVIRAQLLLADQATASLEHTGQQLETRLQKGITRINEAERKSVNLHAKVQADMVAAAVRVEQEVTRLTEQVQTLEWLSRNSLARKGWAVGLLFGAVLASVILLALQNSL